MSQESHCPQCGIPLSAEAPEGFCPKCLLQLAARPEDAAAVTWGPAVPLEEPGTVIGPYKLLEKIGEGGMAVVYMAEQEVPLRRRVALKLIKLGMDTKQVVARFEAERQALALMDHPNIAYVFDAGATEAGRPYFVMELVRGVSITEYCDRNRLSTRERLALFVPICKAVHHAHQKGIIHRDLKPSNIMVTLHDGEPVPKIIDFGIAKATDQRLTEQTLFTRYAEMIGTPEYMSPEQAEMSGLGVDTRTDIYSLGAVLYELLTGALPFDPDTLRSAAFNEIQRIIREEEPLRPSTRLSMLGERARAIAASRRTDVAALTRCLHSELEWIPLKAMHKDRTRRYHSAHEFGDDIGNYLTGVPLIAGPESAAYRLCKLLRKHRVPVATAAFVMAILLVGFVTSTYLYVRVRQAQKAVVTLETTVAADRMLSTAQRLQAEGRYREALGVLDNYLQRGPGEPKAHLLYANLLYVLDRFDAAEAELMPLLEGVPEIAGAAHCLLATMHMGSNPDKAHTHQQAGEALLPQTAEAYTLRGITADGSTSTLQWLSKALALDPGYYPARKARALTFYAVRDYAAMATDAEAMVVMRPKDALGYALRAIARREAGQGRTAMADHHRAIALCDRPAELPELHDQRRRTLIQLRDYQAALRDAEYGAKSQAGGLRSGFELFTTQVLAGDYPAARNQYAQLTVHPRYQDWEFKIWISRHTFKLLIRGHALDLPEAIMREGPFSLMQNAIEQYRVCQGFGTCLIPSAFGLPAWSPDGKELTYGRMDRYATRGQASTSGAPLIYESGGLEALNVESGRVRILAPSCKGSSWSPDGQWIAFDRAPDRGPAGCASELWVIPSAGGQPRYLAHGAWPIWTRHAGRLFYQAGGAAYAIDVDDPPGEPTPVRSCPPYFAVSPDARYLAYADADRLSVVEISSGIEKATWVAPPPEGARGMVLNWASNGKEVLAGGVHESELGLWSFDIEQGQAWQLFPAPAVLASPSPDGSQIAIEIRDWFGGVWVADLDPADSIHAGVRSALTEEEYLRRSCDDLARAIRRGTYRADAPTHLRGFVTRVGALCAAYYRKGQYNDALETFEAVENLCDALGRQPSGAAVAVATMSLHRQGREQEAEANLQRLRRLVRDDGDATPRNLLYEAEKILVGADTEVGRLWGHLAEGNIDEAARYLLANEASEKVQPVRGAAAEAFYRRGREGKHHGRDYGDVMSDYAMTIRLDPNHIWARCDLAWLQAACPEPERRDDAEAVANATRACELTNGEDHRCLATLAAVCAQVGDFAAAVSWQSKAIDRLTEADLARWRGDYESRAGRYASGKPYTQGHLWSFSTGRLLGWWRFDETSGETAADASGNGHTGTVGGTGQWQPRGGRIDGALLTGKGSVRIVDEAPFDVTGAITVSVWARIDAFDRRWQALVTKGDSSWRLHRSNGRNSLEFVGSGLYSPRGASACAEGQRVISDGQWHHVAATYDGRRIALYVDGMLDASCPASGRLQTNDYPVCIGGNAERLGRDWNGWIDDMRIYSYALNQTEIVDLHAAGVQSP